MNVLPGTYVAIGIFCFGAFAPRAEAVITLNWSTDGSNNITVGPGVPDLLDPQEISVAGSLEKPGTLTNYFFSSGGYMVQVMTRNFNQFGIFNTNSIWMEGKIGTVQSTMRMRFFEYNEPGGVGTGFVIGAPTPVNGIHFQLRDTDGSEWLYNFGVYDASAPAYNADVNTQAAPGTLIPYTDSQVFTWSGGAPILKNGDPNYASNNEALESGSGGSQLSKRLDVNLDNYAPDVYGYEFSLRRNSSYAGGVSMLFRAPEPSSALLIAVSGVGMLLRRRRAA